jgi:hypothetical protein
MRTDCVSLRWKKLNCVEKLETKLEDETYMLSSVNLMSMVCSTVSTDTLFFELQSVEVKTIDFMYCQIIGGVYYQ